MKAFALGAVLAGTSLVLVSISTNTPSQLRAGSTLVALEASAPAHIGALAPATLTEVVQRYCVVCHNDGMLTGNVTLQSFDVERAAENAATAERMIRKLRAGMMPPPGQPRPGGDTLQVLVETLEARVDAAARSAPNLGDRRFARLSQAEYERVIKDLLALDVDAGQWLPPDVLMGSFDNMSGAQALSTTLVDAYLRAAIEVARLAVGNEKAVSTTVKYATPAVISQHAWDHVEGTPFGTRGGMVVEHTFPADGQYVIAVATSLGTSNNIWFEDVDVSIDGEPVAVLKLAHNGGGAGGGGNGNNFQNQAASGVVTDPVFIRAGQRRISAAFVDQIDGPYEDRFKVPDASSAAGAAGTPGVTGLTKLDTLTIIGPQSVTGVSDTPSRRKIFSCRPARAAEERACAESILTRLATQAYRRPVTSENVAQLMAFYDEAAAAEGFEVGVRAGLQAILVAPQMMFRLESVPEGVEAGESFRLSDVDLANRLSFFLWASGPDEELLRVATSGRLSNDAELERQVERMLADPRAEALATRFTHQWLRLQDVGKNWPEPYFYPEFSQQLADAMVRETELFFMNLVQQDLSLLELFSADYTFLNERLAKHYGIEGVVGEDFVRVRYPTDQRRGVFGHGSILHLTSMSNRTSPVLRGKWVMEVLMGTPPPPPPPNVPAFEASPSAGAGRRLTTRERMEVHRRSPVCTSCHSFIDPIGLALDNFDATGKWRIRENMAPLDTRGTFYDGTEISQPIQLANVLLKRPIPLVRNFTGNLLAYAIGRPLEYFDQPTVRVIQRDAEANGYKMSSLIMGVVKSDPFQMKQVRTTTN